MTVRIPNTLALASSILALLAISMFSTPVSASAQPAAVQFLPGDNLIREAAGDQIAPAIAKGDTSSLAVWSDARALAPVGFYEGETSRDIYGVRIDAAGKVLDATPIAITAAKANQENPQVVWNGSNWLVVFETYVLSGTGYYYEKSLGAVRVSPSGQVLDAEPIPIHGISASPGQWAVASDGSNWVIVFVGSSASADVMALRISASGRVLDPPNHSLVPATYYIRGNLHLAYAGGVFLVTFGDEYVGGNFDTKAIRFDSSLTPLDTQPIPLLPVQLSGIASNGNQFYIVWNEQQADFTMAVMGSRVSIAGQKLDGNGVNISRNHPPQAYTTTAVVWDGSGWKVTWGAASVFIARVAATGQVLDPGGIAVPGLTSGPAAPTSNGGVQLVWSTFANNNYDVFTANISPANVAGPVTALSVGAPMQLPVDAAATGAGYVAVYRSITSSEVRILAQALDKDATPVGIPVLLDAGDPANAPGAPAVAWNGSVFLAVWSKAGRIVGQRLNANAAKLDAAPIVVVTAGSGSVDVAALGDTFLVVALKVSTPEIIYPIAVRVQGVSGAVLDAVPKVIGGSFASKPKVTVLGQRWLAAWQQNATHDNPAANTMATFVNADGSALSPFSVYSYSTAGGNGIFDIGLASSGGVALVVQSAETTSGVETDLIARLVAADGQMQPAINLTPWVGNQYRPRAAWDGRQFVVAYQEQRNRLAPWTLDQLDARSDLFGMRITSTGSVVDPRGFVFAASPQAESHPSVTAANGISLFTGSIMRNETGFANYRAGYRPFGTGGNQWPVAMAAANPAGGDVPITVAFSSAGSRDPDGSIATYFWDFRDGTTSTAANPVHTYSVAGPFVALLTVTDNAGAATTQTVLVEAVSPNQLPIAMASAVPPSGPAPFSPTFYATGSYDPDGLLGNFLWNFGNGVEYWGPVAYNTFADPGTYPVTLTVFDSRGATATATISVTVKQANRPPVAMAAATPLSGVAPLQVSFSSAGSTDPDGTIASYLWTFGDGASSTQANPVHTYSTPGTYSAQLTVTDNQGRSGSASVAIAVAAGACTSNCLRSTSISLGVRGFANLTFTGDVTVMDQKGVAVQSATVSITWTLPDGGSMNQTAVTSRSGLAKFSLSGGSGTYTLTVKNISKAGMTFDAAGSVLTKSITR